MKKLHSLLLAATSLAFTACVGQTYRVDVGAMFAKASGNVTLQNSAGNLQLFQEKNFLDNDLGVGDIEPSPYLRLQADQEQHRLRAHGFGVDATGSGTLAGDYGDLAGGSQVTTSLRFLAAGLTYSYEIARDENYRVGVGAALNWYSLDVSARSSVGRESVQTDVLVPMPYLEVEGFLGPLTAGANLGLMSADLGDANGRYIDLETYVRWQAVEQLDVMVGYRYLVMDPAGRASSRDFDADVEIQGFFVGGGVRF
ncbi:MAG: hypothetical protein JNM25_14150 [Planctomycetes bacterium]|nr:hypothetical protein [Planctomycetota bacterium]